jgi:hypothetical protein
MEEKMEPIDLPIPDGIVIKTFKFSIDDGMPSCELFDEDKTLIGILSSDSLGVLLMQVDALQDKFPKAKRRFDKNFTRLLVDASLTVEFAIGLDMVPPKVMTRLNRKLGNFLVRN